MTPLWNVGALEKRSKSVTLLYLILITLLLIMVCVVALAILSILRPSEPLSSQYFNPHLQTLPANASTVSSIIAVKMDKQSEKVFLSNTEAESPQRLIDIKKPITEEFPKSGTSTKTLEMETSTERSAKLRDKTTEQIVTQGPISSSRWPSPTSTSASTSAFSSTISASVSTSTLSSISILPSIFTITSSSSSTFDSTSTSTSVPWTAITQTPSTIFVSTTSGHRAQALDKGMLFGSRNVEQFLTEPINAVRIDFENAVLEFDEIQMHQNTTSPEIGSLRGNLSDMTPSTTSGSTVITSSSTAFIESNNRINDRLLENIAPQCVKKKTQKCRPAVQRNAMSRDVIPLENTAAELGHFGGFRAIHYSLNITINRDMHISYQGSVEIMLKVVENTSTVFVHVGRPIAIIDLAQIDVWNCLTGNVLCVSSMVQHLHHELLSIDLTEPVFSGQYILLRVSNFGSPRAHNGFVVQNPHKWEPKRPWTVTTLFQMRDARSIMPSIDVPSMKATLDLCVTHPPGTEARSNSPLQKSVAEGKIKITSCFERTSPMSTYLYAITVFNRMHSIYQAADHTIHLPELEIFYSEQMSSEKPIWIKMETIQALRFMRNFTGFEYPLKKLSLIATSLPVNGVENFGLITLNERWMAYPKYSMAHSILAHEIAHQWIGNVVTVTTWNEICLQEGLTTYLEWLLTAEFDNSTSAFDTLNEKRTEAIARDTKNNAAIISDFRTHDDIFRCFDKPAIFFVMLESGFGAGVVSKLAHLLMERYAYGNAGVHQWHQLITEAAHNELAGQFFENYFTQPGVPLVRVSYTSNGITLKQETIVAAMKANTSALVIPLDLSLDGSKTRLKILLSEKEQTFPLKHYDMVVVDPDIRAYAVVVYEAEIYIRLLQCAQADSCIHLNSTHMQHIADDFCWAFLNDHLMAHDSTRQSLRAWAQFMRLLSASNYVRGSCSCCMNKNLNRSFNVPCKWHWKDRCQHIQIVKQILKLPIPNEQ